ncbi:MAG: hypothetical protein RIR26_2366 [Pseudomonadota bacterium]
MKRSSALLFLFAVLAVPACKPRTFNSSSTESVSSKPTGGSKEDSKTSSVTSIDLRPTGRPAKYDVEFRHERIFDCGESGRVEVIWRQAGADGKILPKNSQYILGLAAQLKDPAKGELLFSTVTMDSAPAFFAGEQPSPVTYLNPMFVFDEAEVKAKLSYHSAIPGLTGRTLAAGGTLWVPLDGSGNSVSVAIALGGSVRGQAYQLIADCKPAHDKVNNWLMSCVGRESIDSKSQCQR